MLPHRSPLSRRCRGALRDATWEESFIVARRRSPSSRCPDGGEHRRSAPEGGALCRGAPGEPFTAAARRSPFLCHAGGVLHHSAQVFLEPLMVPCRRRPSSCRAGGALCGPGAEEPFAYCPCMASVVWYFWYCIVRACIGYGTVFIVLLISIL